MNNYHFNLLLIMKYMFENRIFNVKFPDAEENLNSMIYDAENKINSLVSLIDDKKGQKKKINILFKSKFLNMIKKNIYDTVSQKKIIISREYEESSNIKNKIPFIQEKEKSELITYDYIIKDFNTINSKNISNYQKFQKNSSNINKKLDFKSKGVINKNDLNIKNMRFINNNIYKKANLNNSQNSSKNLRSLKLETSINSVRSRNLKENSNYENSILTEKDLNITFNRIIHDCRDNMKKVTQISERQLRKKNLQKSPTNDVHLSNLIDKENKKNNNEDDTIRENFLKHFRLGKLKSSNMRIKNLISHLKINCE